MRIYIHRGSPLGYSDGVSAAERLCEFFVDPCQRIVSHSARVWLSFRVLERYIFGRMALDVNDFCAGLDE